MMRILVFVAVVALVATLSIPVLASEAERSAQEIGTGIDEFATPTRLRWSGTRWWSWK